MSVRIGLGLAAFPFSGPEAFWRWVDLCEASRVDSLWFSERLVSTQPVLEPMAALAALAGRTRRLKFGMNAVVLPFRDPLVLAKECATIDFLSGGRLLPMFGVGADAAPEWRATGRDPSGRGARSDEMLQVMVRLWSEESVSFRGRFFQYESASISPRPVQQPLPLWIGGSSEAAVRRTAALGSGWLAGSGQTPEAVAGVVAAIKAKLLETGREIEEDHYGAGFPFRFGSWEEPVVQRAAQLYAARAAPGADARELVAVGGARQVIDLVLRFRAAGVSKFVLRPIAASDADVLEQTRLLDAEVIPAVHALE